MKRFLGTKSVFFFGLCFALGFYGSCIEPFTLRVKEWTIVTPKWESEKELRIALLSDIHMIWPWMTPNHLHHIVERTNELRPDIVLLLGDYVGDHFFGAQINPEEGVVPLKNLSAPCGVYAVRGNHDVFNPIKATYPEFLRINPTGWPEAIIKTGIPFLQNKAQRVDCAGRNFWVAGLGDHFWEKEDAAGAVGQVTDGRPVIMMMHNPDSFVKVPSSVALSVAGHTHGGQIHIPFYGPVASVIPSRYGLKYVYGFIHENDKDLVVTSGLGMTGIPIRFGVPPEIAIITLKSAH